MYYYWQVKQPVQDYNNYCVVLLSLLCKEIDYKQSLFLFLNSSSNESQDSVLMN